MAAEEEEIEEEGRRAVGIPGPERVSKEEREAHERTHLPYRSWWEVCVKARGRKRGNCKQKGNRGDKGLEKAPRIVMDYLYMSESDREAGKRPILCMKDESTGCRFARLVARKGLGGDGEVEWLILDACAEIKAWGHPGGEGNRIILKSDGESGLCALRDAIGKFHGGIVITETSARGESQSNGAAEQNVLVVSEFIRVLKLQIDERTGLTIGADHTIYPWIVRWAPMLSSRFAVGADGKTPHERMRGRRCKIPVVPLGEFVIYKEIREGKTEEHVRHR